MTIIIRIKAKKIVRKEIYFDIRIVNHSIVITNENKRKQRKVKNYDC